jgi:hypothetical protein
MRDSLLIGIIALILSISVHVTVAAIVRRALTEAFRALNLSNDAHQRQMSGLLDRFQAIAWEDLAALRATEDAELGGFEAPTVGVRVTDEDDEATEIQVRGPWGTIRGLSDRMRADRGGAGATGRGF